jgi:protein FrlC
VIYAVPDRSFRKRQQGGKDVVGTISKSQVAIGNYHYVAYSFDYFLNSVKSIGAENIELWGAKPHFCVDDQNRESVREFRKRVEDKGLSLICFCPEQNTYPVDISCRDTSLRKRSIEHMKRAIEITSWLGADRMLLCPGNGYADEPEEDIWKRCRASMEDLSGTAKEQGVCLMLETQSQEESLFMNTVYQQKEMMNQVDHPSLKAMLDTVQLAQFDQSVRDDIKILGIENVRHVHLGNTLVQERTWYDTQLPERLRRGRKVTGHIGLREGNLPIGQYLEELAAVGYKGYITIEICQRAYFMDAHRYAREAFDYVTGYMAGQ